ncbi:DUF2635 domain-containing protein [Caballeronia sp. LZ033]|uniref:DUF2635 domain-containing protein n=1 Tax=Caballeronia sp. LZ033 TaxID=3038566 RepID=UPI00286452D8|nr:DUF2635 domain-containing protein [Caballeronia sp. LZ033]MDR5813319.1 DUF2635 domain-containing protein [Caballeronia sp. LZ033]
MIVKPAPGLKVRHPDTKQFLPPEGITVPDGDIFWTRAVNDGDVVVVDADAAAEHSQEDAVKEQPAALPAPVDEEADQQ